MTTIQTKLIATAFLMVFGFTQAQINNLFRAKERLDYLETFDQQKFSWGFFLGANHYDFKFIPDPTYGVSESKGRNLVESKGSYGFGAGLIGRMRLNESLDLRIEPGLHFVQRTLTFNTKENQRFLNPSDPEPVFSDAEMNRTLKSTYIDIPILIEFHGDRWYNSRPYAAAGINYLANLQSNEKSADDNSLQVFRTTTHNFGWSVEAGIQLYFYRFKLTPAFRGTFFMNNELIKDNPSTPPFWADALNSAQSRAFMFILKFE